MHCSALIYEWMYREGVSKCSLRSTATIVQSLWSYMKQANVVLDFGGVDSWMSWLRFTLLKQEIKHLYASWIRLDILILHPPHVHINDQIVTKSLCHPLSYSVFCTELFVLRNEIFVHLTFYRVFMHWINACTLRLVMQGFYWLQNEMSSMRGGTIEEGT